MTVHDRDDDAWGVVQRSIFDGNTVFFSHVYLVSGIHDRGYPCDIGSA